MKNVIEISYLVFRQFLQHVLRLEQVHTPSCFDFFSQDPSNWIPNLTFYWSLPEILQNHCYLIRYNVLILKNNNFRHSISYKCSDKVYYLASIHKISLPFNNEPPFPSPTEALRRSPAPELIPDMSEKGARLVWFGVPIPFESPLWLQPPGGVAGCWWCNPDTFELVLLQEWDWLIFKWLLAEIELLWALECELEFPPPCK